MKNPSLSTLSDRKKKLELNWIEKKERKCSVCKRWSCNSHCEHLEIQFDYGGNSLWQRNSRKIDKRRKELGLLYIRQQSWNLKQAITLKHLISYSNLKMFINLKGMIDMPIIGLHVWGHAYEHDKICDLQTVVACGLFA